MSVFVMLIMYISYTHLLINTLLYVLYTIQNQRMMTAFDRIHVIQHAQQCHILNGDTNIS